MICDVITNYLSYLTTNSIIIVMSRLNTDKMCMCVCVIYMKEIWCVFLEINKTEASRPNHKIEICLSRT